MKTAKKTGRERRQWPRLEHCLPVKVAANGYDFATTTQNVSCLGAYCNITKYVPPFTRVMVKLTLPIGKGGNAKECSLECSGVVVRTEDESKGGFNIAVFFNQIKNEQRKIISEYISRFLPEKSASLKN